MDSKSKRKLELLEKAIERLEEKKRKIEEAKREEEIREWLRRKDEGWQIFVLYSSYYGSECGEDSEIHFFCFAPHVNIEKWEKVEFSHGNSTQAESNTKFGKFINSLTERVDYESYLDEEVVQAVWPEVYKKYEKYL